jgi:hypothetical protein
VRSVVQRKSRIDPPYFLRDLLRHGAIGSLGRRLQPRQTGL